MIRHKKITGLVAFFLFLALIWANPVHAAGANVATMDELEAAIKGGQSPITLTQGFTVTKGLEIPASYEGEIRSSGQTLALGFGVDNMFTIADGAKVTFDNIIFDGQGNGRILMRARLG